MVDKVIETASTLIQTPTDISSINKLKRQGINLMVLVSENYRAPWWTSPKATNCTQKLKKAVYSKSWCVKTLIKSHHRTKSLRSNVKKKVRTKKRLFKRLRMITMMMLTCKWLVTTIQTSSSTWWIQTKMTLITKITSWTPSKLNKISTTSSNNSWLFHSLHNKLTSIQILTIRPKTRKCRNSSNHLRIIARKWTKAHIRITRRKTIRIEVIAAVILSNLN